MEKEMEDLRSRPKPQSSWTVPKKNRADPPQTSDFKLVHVLPLGGRAPGMVGASDD